MRKAIAAITAMVICAIAITASASSTPVYVSASELNGRAEAGMEARVEASFFLGDELEALGFQNGWVEVIGGETGTVWCKAEHLTEYAVNDTYKNTSGGRVFIHRELGDDSKNARHAVENGRRVTITRVLFGYGYMGSGLVDLGYFEREDDSGA